MHFVSYAINERHHVDFFVIAYTAVKKREKNLILGLVWQSSSNEKSESISEIHLDLLWSSFTMDLIFITVLGTKPPLSLYLTSTLTPRVWGLNEKMQKKKTFLLSPISRILEQGQSSWLGVKRSHYHLGSVIALGGGTVSLPTRFVPCLWLSLGPRHRTLTITSGHRFSSYLISYVIKFRIASNLLPLPRHLLASRTKFLHLDFSLLKSLYTNCGAKTNRYA